MHPFPIVSIIGRPNVGKSSLFNRLTQSRQAVTSAKAGTTRDRHHLTTSWQNVPFSVVDTGGLEIVTRDHLQQEIKKQCLIALSESQLILFLVDLKTGITNEDWAIHKILLPYQDHVLLVVNKVDNEQEDLAVHEFHKLGFSHFFPISSTHGRNLHPLLETIINKIRHSPKQPESQREVIKIAIVGQPNVGKSSLVNALLRQKRCIVDDRPGTTRDAIDTAIRYNGQDFVLIDTAGLRRVTRMEEETEYYCYLRTLAAMDRADICILLTEANRGFSQFEMKIAENIVDRNKGFLLAVNKWDLISKDTHTADEQTKTLYQKLPMIRFVPVLYLSVLKHLRIYKTLDWSLKIYHNLKRRIAPEELHNLFEKKIVRHKHPSVGSKFVTIENIHQTGIFPPAFTLQSNLPNRIKKNYKQFVCNLLWENFELSGCPLVIKTA